MKKAKFLFGLAFILAGIFGCTDDIYWGDEVTFEEVMNEGRSSKVTFYAQDPRSVEYSVNSKSVLYTMGTRVTEFPQNNSDVIMALKAGYSANSWHYFNADDYSDTSVPDNVKLVELFSDDSVSSFLVEGKPLSFYCDDWYARIDIDYTVKTYLENANDSGYTLKESTKWQGQTDTVPTAGTDFNEPTYANFTVISDYDVPSISGYGTSVISIYYKRNTFDVTFNAGSLDSNAASFPDGATTKTLSFKYEQNITFPDITFSVAGVEMEIYEYEIDGTTYETLPTCTSALTVTPHWRAKTPVTYTVSWMWQTVDAADNNTSTEASWEVHETKTITGQYLGDAMNVSEWTNKTYTGFIQYSTTGINGTSTVTLSTVESGVKIYYKRNEYGVTLKPGSFGGIQATTGSGDDATTSDRSDNVRYGSSVSSWVSGLGLTLTYGSDDSAVSKPSAWQRQYDGEETITTLTETEFNNETVPAKAVTYTPIWQVYNGSGEKVTAYNILYKEWQGPRQQSAKVFAASNEASLTQYCYSDSSVTLTKPTLTDSESNDISFAGFYFDAACTDDNVVAQADDSGDTYTLSTDNINTYADKSTNTITLYGKYNYQNIYIDVQNGNDTNTGYDADHPVQSLGEAKAYLYGTTVSNPSIMPLTPFTSKTDIENLSDLATSEYNNAVVKKSKSAVDSAFISTSSTDAITLKNVTFDGGAVLTSATSASALANRTNSGVACSKPQFSFSNNVTMQSCTIQNIDCNDNNIFVSGNYTFEGCTIKDNIASTLFTESDDTTFKLKSYTDSGTTSETNISYNKATSSSDPLILVKMTTDISNVFVITGAYIASNYSTGATISIGGTTGGIVFSNLVMIGNYSTDYSSDSSQIGAISIDSTLGGYLGLAGNIQIDGDIINIPIGTFSKLITPQVTFSTTEGSGDSAKSYPITVRLSSYSEGTNVIDLTQLASTASTVLSTSFTLEDTSYTLTETTTGSTTYGSVKSSSSGN